MFSETTSETQTSSSAATHHKFPSNPHCFFPGQHHRESTRDVSCWQEAAAGQQLCRPATQGDMPYLAHLRSIWCQKGCRCHKEVFAELFFLSSSSLIHSKRKPSLRGQPDKQRPCVNYSSAQLKHLNQKDLILQASKTLGQWQLCHPLH